MNCTSYSVLKKSLCVFSAILFSTTIISGCTNQENQKKLVKVSICVSNQTPTARALKEIFEPMVEKETNGRYDVELYTSGVLGSEKVSYDYTRASILEMCVVGTPMWSETDTMSIPDFPFVFRDVEHARKSYQGELGDFIKKDIEKTQPIKLLAWFPNGARVFTSNKKLQNLDDFKGQKLRMPNNPIHVKLAESLGANVVIMDLGEVFTALEQGVADGQDNPIATVKTEGWHEVQKYIYNTNHIVASLELFAGNDFWNALSEKDKEVFIKAAKKTSDYAWDLYIEQLETDKKFMLEKGLEITELSQDDRQKMIQKIKPVYDYLDLKYEWAKDVRKMIESIN